MGRKNVEEPTSPSDTPEPTASHQSLKLELPQIVRTRKGDHIRPCEDIQTFIHHELDVSRLDTIAERLWLAGRSDNARPLHRQRLLGRSIVITEQADLHLTWNNGIIFVKPLPAWLLDHDFFERHLRKSPALPEALGFLKSYIFLLSYQSDFRLAVDLHLLPDDLTWPIWLEIVRDLLPKVLHRDPDSSTPQSPRYAYGELRLNRLNLIYRFEPRFRLRHFCRAYHYSNRTYQSFINRNFGWLLVVFVYVTILLTAMQLGLATSKLRENGPFNAASYGFSVFSLVVPLGTVLYGAALSAILVVYNVMVTLRHLKVTMGSGLDKKPVRRETVDGKGKV